MDFAQRFGFEKPPLFQIDSANADLRTAVSNIFHVTIVEGIKRQYPYPGSNHNPELEKLYEYLWMYFFNWDVGKLMHSLDFEVLISIKKYLGECEWHKVYALIEHTIKFLSLPVSDNGFHLRLREEMLYSINKAMKSHYSAYSLINSGEFIQITNEQELTSINEAVAQSSTKKLLAVNNHIAKAIGAFSSKPNPDYDTTVAESLHALESLGQILSHKQSNTLKPALDAIKNKLELPEELVEGVKSMYDYASKYGLQHGQQQLTHKPTFDEAKLMLVTSSCIISYTISKANTASLLPPP